VLHRCAWCVLGGVTASSLPYLLSDSCSLPVLLPLQAASVREPGGVGAGKHAAEHPDRSQPWGSGADSPAQGHCSTPQAFPKVAECVCAVAGDKTCRQYVRLKHSPFSSPCGLAGSLPVNAKAARAKGAIHSQSLCPFLARPEPQGRAGNTTAFLQTPEDRAALGQGPLSEQLAEGAALRHWRSQHKGGPLGKGVKEQAAQPLTAERAQSLRSPRWCGI